MRGIFSGILQRWRNVTCRVPFPMFFGWPYTFRVSQRLAKEVKITISSSLYAMQTDVTYTPAGGTEKTDTHYTYGGWTGTISNLEVGTFVTIRSTSYVNGFWLNGQRIYKN